MPQPIPVLILFGPTASGKTDVLERLFTGEAPVCAAEIVSADSMQVYRGMDIGTAKPSPRLRAQLPHHLIDIREPNEPFNVGDFVRLADLCCADIAARGNIPVLSGGTGFYLKHFVHGMPAAPPSDADIRRELKAELLTHGVNRLAEELAACDPPSAARIHRNDEYRLLRALEVYRLTGRPLSAFAATASTGARRQYRFLMVGLEHSREALYARINARAAAMFRAGLADEVRRLFAAGYTPRDPGLRAIGYQEFFEEAADGAFSLKRDLAEVETLVARNSRRYAKRQNTYFASLADTELEGQPPVHRLSAGGDPSAALCAELAALRKNLS
ncbi:MAG: tRNA (adenosine(37)-N6)-dimethylallyltransferase MiaA [Treponema sp.]|jgi:tRNA dimethylallyltransferase|nr:tRNA (adenosine(37)-N6)-dimethylallyltransferase MiaA [Treponema sp.]